MGATKATSDSSSLTQDFLKEEAGLSCQYYQEAQERGDVTPPPVQPTILHHFFQQSASKPAASSAASRSVSRSSIEDGASTSSAKRSRCVCQYFNPVFSIDDHEEFERLLIQFQADNCLPDRFIKKLSSRRLFLFSSTGPARGLFRSEKQWGKYWITTAKSKKKLKF
ncbi:hypothetical protein GQ600_23725 [Phytophthora cactorum]|nr:hypothetical protein GQ600_23725 [Phytophthora cactorum]